MTSACDFEPLERLARFAWDWAPALCDPAHGCLDYHRSWSLVRLLELGGAVPSGSAFFQREIAALAREGGRRVLISGGADTGVTSLVVDAFRAAQAEPDLVFVDRCRTPCWQNRLFARERGSGWEVLNMDAQDIDCAPVDAVVAHSFLHLLDARVRTGVLAAWARVVKPGGRVLLSCALSAGEDDWVRTKDAELIGERRMSLERAAGAAGFAPAQAREIAAAAARFWATSPGRPPALTRENVRASLQNAGFELVSIDTSPIASVKGPLAVTTRETSPRERAEIVAVRRQAVRGQRESLG
ncbi:MAG TPA: class I SAM-dependent methyltransferase [Ramlibacter sp.]|uniref:class I SAM-dependent methyltransferase n=1 Tax=Ramlibacter sp. TaxID=1917967 RepID=UPI002BE1E06C|nr:class I SAM-dependent methyltransferase [Ramlibacter sp.]HVZ43457.1 class I SAM-dependent methyltransferase [Ramlibacter sp.]